MLGHLSVQRFYHSLASALLSQLTVRESLEKLLNRQSFLLSLDTLTVGGTSCFREEGGNLLQNILDGLEGGLRVRPDSEGAC